MKKERRTNMEAIFVLIMIAVVVIMGMRTYNMNIAPAVDNSKLNHALNNGCVKKQVNGLGSTLTLVRRDRALYDNLRLSKDYSANFKDDPVEVHFGAATVGGVTTGGVYTTGGGTIMTDLKKTGTFTLYLGSDIFSNVILDKSLISEAKNSMISKYLIDFSDGTVRLDTLNKSQEACELIRRWVSNME